MHPHTEDAMLLFRACFLYKMDVHTYASTSIVHKKLLRSEQHL